jgi:hypothetical protein
MLCYTISHYKLSFWAAASALWALARRCEGAPIPSSALGKPWPQNGIIIRGQVAGGIYPDTSVGEDTHALGAICAKDEGLVIGSA